VADSTNNSRRDFRLSLGVVALIVASALCGLAFNANWPKFLRVLLAFSTYSTILLLLFRRATPGALPLWPFALAAGAAELASGWLRPNATALLSLSVAPAAALLIGGAHWLALRSWRPLRGRIAAPRNASGEHG
jgi:hypothetical protein